jgi:hypothetical protein
VLIQVTSSRFKKPEFECLYCKQIIRLHYDRKQPKYPVEHVMPKQMGHFKQNMTLELIVCKECNQYFSEGIENSFGRDSVYGILHRVITNHFDEKSFSNSIKQRRNKLFFNVDYPEYGSAIVNLGLDENALFRVSLADQFVLLNSTKGVSKHFPLNELPHRGVLESVGWPMHTPNISFLGPAIKPERMQSQISLIKTTLEAADIRRNMKLAESMRLPSIPPQSPLYFSSVIDEDIVRVIAKIGLNYFTYVFGHTLALKEYFNEIRFYIWRGFKSGHNVVSMTKNNIFSSVEKLKNYDFNHHQITILQRGHAIIAIIKLFNRDIFEVTLTKDYPLICANLESSHKFSLSSRTIEKILLHPHSLSQLV